MRLRGAFLCATLILPNLAHPVGWGLSGPGAAQAQTYRNVVNAPFNTVSNGPLQAIIVDVPTTADRAAVDRAVAARVIAARRQREPIIQREMEAVRRFGINRITPGIPDIVLVRQNGRLALPVSGRTRGHDANNLTFDFLPDGQPGGWTVAQRQELQAILDIVYPALKNVYGPPSWSGAVKIINGDTTPNIIPDRPALSGGIYNASTAEITFAQYNSPQTKVLNLTQMVALAFRGPNAISYDAWERGMARGATMVTVREVLPLIDALYGGGAVDVTDPLWHALDRYELLNQPPLGNDRFFPVSKTNEPVNPSSLAGMLVPRLQMAGSAWLKVATENSRFFAQFNELFYHGLAGNPGIKNSIPELKALAAQVAPQVEGLAFSDWYLRQYILDTSVSPGDKLYAWPFPLRPDQPADDDFSMGVVLVYYRTILDANGNSDEVNLSGTSYPVYWDFEFSTRLFLGAQYERVDIRDGLGSVAPTFFNTIGGAPAQEGRMRIALDFPVGSDGVRLYTAPRSMGKQNSPNNFWGVVVNADSGTMRIETETGIAEDVPVVQGAFGAAIPAAAFSRPNRATLTFTPAGGGTPTVRRVNVGYREYVAVFHANQDPVTSVTRTFPPGPAMISFPIQPLRPKAAEALTDANGNPIFNDTNLLMAQWRQSIPGEDKYLRYPNMDPLTPGYGYWSNFPSSVTTTIRGRTLAQEPSFTTGLLFGWNQIGNPYTQPINIQDLRFQYLADNVPQTLAQAITRGWIAVATIPTVGDVVVYGFNPQSGYFKSDVLEPWQGYWIRILVSEGLTITYPNPGLGGRAARISRAADNNRPPSSGWAVPLTLRGPAGIGAVAYIGQAPGATNGYDVKSDALRPPDFTRGIPAAAFLHDDWGANSGAYLSDVRPLGSREAWELTLQTPQSSQPYTLTWGNLNSVPRGTRLVLVDEATGRRQYLENSSGYSFTPGSAATRKFRIEVENRGRNGLRVLNVLARQTRSAAGSRVDISYELSAGADVTAEVRDASGKLIRRFGSGRAAPGGVNQVIWDTKDDRGVAIPSGAYILQITARTPEGESARAIHPVIVVR